MARLLLPWIKKLLQEKTANFATDAKLTLLYEVIDNQLTLNAIALQPSQFSVDGTWLDHWVSSVSSGGLKLIFCIASLCLSISTTPANSRTFIANCGPDWAILQGMIRTRNIYFLSTWNEGVCMTKKLLGNNNESSNHIHINHIIKPIIVVNLILDHWLVNLLWCLWWVMWAHGCD